MPHKYSAVHFLLVEDSPGDVRLTQEAFHDANSAVELHVVSYGLEAMAFLRHAGEHVDAPRPDLILLDLNLPKLDGREVLALIKEDGSEDNSHRCAVNFRGTNRHPQELSAACELLSHQTSAAL
jgi:CheY-like chemotaxis protein